jgi:hypothetical protein
MIAHLGRFCYAESTLVESTLANLALAFTNKRHAVYTSIE